MKLRECPYCGSENVVPVDYYLDYFYVSCSKCESCGPRKDTERKAVNAWNKRPLLPVRRTAGDIPVEDSEKKCSHTFDNPRCPHC